MADRPREITIEISPVLEQALENLRAELPEMDDAELLAELAVRGAPSPPPNTGNPHLDRILAMPGVKPPEGDLKEILEKIARDPPRLSAKEKADLDAYIEWDRDSRF